MDAHSLLRGLSDGLCPGVCELVYGCVGVVGDSQVDVDLAVVRESVGLSLFCAEELDVGVW